MPLPIPSPVGAWKKILIATKDAVTAGVTYLSYEYIGEMQQAPSAAGGADADTWRKFVMKWEDTTSLDPADDQQLAIEVVNMTGGVVDNSWTEGDYMAVAGQLGTFMDGLVTTTCARLRCTRIDAYVRAYAPLPANYEPGQKVKHFVDSGPPVWNLAVNKTGTGGNDMAPQVCSTITEMTAARKHWGRNYMPTIGSASVDSRGRLLPATQTQLLTWWHALYEALSNAEYLPVVPSVFANSVPTHALQGITGVRIDDTLDVIRRRRFNNPSTVTQLPVE